jgi:hypothetical protein
MRNLPLPSRDAARQDLVKAITTYRYAGETRGHKITDDELDEVLALYDRYDQDSGQPCDELKGGELPPALTRELRKAYDKTQERGKLVSIREMLFANADLCPICGIDPASELDHHLPRSVFKPLAIYARNLVPMCHACNHAKLAGFCDAEAEERNFLHAYFNILPDADFLRADVDIRDGGLVIEFGVVENVLPGDYAGRLADQMIALKLNDRYRSEVNTYISGHAITLHLHHASGGADKVRDFLNLQARYEKQALYRNHWRPTLLGALAAHDEFVTGGFTEVLPVPAEMLEDWI